MLVKLSQEINKNFILLSFSSPQGKQMGWQKPMVSKRKYNRTGFRQVDLRILHCPANWVDCGKKNSQKRIFEVPLTSGIILSYSPKEQLSLKCLQILDPNSLQSHLSQISTHQFRNFPYNCPNAHSFPYLPSVFFFPKGKCFSIMIYIQYYYILFSGIQHSCYTIIYFTKVSHPHISSTHTRCPFKLHTQEASLILPSV